MMPCGMLYRMSDRIERVRVSLAFLPLKAPSATPRCSRAGRSRSPKSRFVFAEIESRDGHSGLGFGYSKRAGGPGMFAHAKEIAPNLIGEDPNDIAALVHQAPLGRRLDGAQRHGGPGDRAVRRGAVGHEGASARGLPLAKLLGSHRDSIQCYNTSGGFLSLAARPRCWRTSTCTRARGIGGIKIKVGHPDARPDIERVSAVRKHLGDSFPLMVDANQQWDRPAAHRMGRAFEEFGLVWIEEPLDAWDNEGHAELAATLRHARSRRAKCSPATTSTRTSSIPARCDFVQPDCPRVGGVTPFMQILALADHKGLKLAPHFAMEIHVHLAAAYPREPWLEHFEWLEPLFNERLELHDGRMKVPDRPGVGFSLSGQARAWTKDSAEFR